MDNQYHVANKKYAYLYIIYTRSIPLIIFVSSIIYLYIVMTYTHITGDHTCIWLVHVLPFGEVTVRLAIQFLILY